MKAVAKEQFIRGVKGAVAEFEKKASFQSWMSHPKFREKFASQIVHLIKKVRG